MCFVFKNRINVFEFYHDFVSVITIFPFDVLWNLHKIALKLKNTRRRFLTVFWCTSPIEKNGVLPMPYSFKLKVHHRANTNFIWDRTSLIMWCLCCVWIILHARESNNVPQVYLLFSLDDELLFKSTNTHPSTAWLLNSYVLKLK